MSIYIASDRPLTTIEWDEGGLALYVYEIGEPEDGVRRQFSKPYVYFADSHLGCGCGFRYKRWQKEGEDSETSADERARREAMRRLAGYLSTAAETGDVELYACWGGEEEYEPLCRDTISPEEIGGELFAFDERQFLTIRTPPAPGADPA